MFCPFYFAVHLLLCHSMALLVNCALFLPFTAQIMPVFLQFTALKCPFDGPFTTLKCPFDGPFTALKCPFQMAPCPLENLGRTLHVWEMKPLCATGFMDT